MSILSRLSARGCPVCGAGTDQGRLFLEARLDPDRLTGHSFASRKQPEFMSYRLLRCGMCATVYAAAAPPADSLARVYAVAEYDSGEEAELAADTYAAALAPVIAALPVRGAALDIGAGTGVLLDRLLQAGFATATGVEPSHAAIAAAPPGLRPLIRPGVFREADFAPMSLDLICCCQTLEHVSDPRGLAAACARLLRPGGVLALVTHDYRAPVNRLLGRRSPIIDIEHLQLFCPDSLHHLLAQAGLRPQPLTRLRNRYHVRYWFRLTPLPAGVKQALGPLLDKSGLGHARLSLDVGNVLAIGRKPGQDGVMATGTGEGALAVVA